MEVRTASLADAAMIARFLCDQMYPEMDLGFAPLDETEALNTVARLTEHGRVLMLLDGGSLVGAVGLESGRRFWWSKAEALGDFFFYIAPSHRRWGAHRALTNAAKDAAKQAGLPLILGGFGSPRLSILNRLFRLLGFQEIGSLYLWR